MKTQRTSLDLINRVLDVIRQQYILQPFTIEVHIGPGLMFYLLPELLAHLRSLSRLGETIDVVDVQHEFMYCGHKFIVNPELGNGFSIHIDGGLVVDYYSPSSTYAP